MPNRYVRESAIESETVDRLSWAGEVFWRRLLNRADDFGRFTANKELLRASLFPLRLNKVSAADVGKMLLECEQSGLVSTWKGEDGKEYLAVHKWEKGRAKFSRYPEPPPSVCLQMQTFANTRSQMQTDVPDYDTDTDSDSDNDIREIFEEFRKAYPGAKDGSEVAWSAFRKKNPKVLAETVSLLLPALNREIAHKVASKEAGVFTPPWANLSTWINQKRWTQELPEIVKGSPNGANRQSHNQRLEASATSFLSRVRSRGGNRD